MNKIAVVLLVLTAAIGISHTALAQQNALNILTVNAAKRLKSCNFMAFEADLSKADHLTNDETKQRYLRADACIATAKKDTNLEYQAAHNLVKNNPRYVARLNRYYTYWLSVIGSASSTKDKISNARDKLEQLAEPLNSGQ